MKIINFLLKLFHFPPEEALNSEAWSFFSLGSNNLTLIFSSAVTENSSSLSVREKRLITLPLDTS